MNKFLKSRKKDCLVFAGLYFLVSILYLLETSDFPHRAFPVADALYYYETAARLTETGLSTMAVFSLSKIYLLYVYLNINFVHFLSSIFPNYISPIEFICYTQSIISAAAVGFTVYLAGIYSRIAGILCGLFLLGFGPFYFFQGVTIPVALVTSLCAICLYYWINYYKKDKLVFLIISALLFGLLIDLRPHFLILLPVLIIIIVTNKANRLIKNKLVISSLFLFITLIPTLFLGVIISLGEDKSNLPIRSSFGLNFYMGNHANASGLYKKIAEINNEPFNYQKSSHDYAETIEGEPLTNSQANFFWIKKAFGFYIDSPISGFKLLLKKFQHLLSNKEFPVNYDYTVQKSFSSILNLLVVNFGFLLPFAFIFLFIKTENPLYIHTKLWFLFYTLSLLIFFVASDHRLPLIIPTAILASCMIVKLYEYFIKKNYHKFVIATSGILLLSWVSLSDATNWAHHQSYHQIGEMSLALNNPSFALRAFQEATNEKPDFIPSIEMLASINQHLENYQGATEWYKKAIQINPNEENYWKNLAICLYLSGKEEKAMEICEKVLGQAHPANYLQDSLLKSSNKIENLYSK